MIKNLQFYCLALIISSCAISGKMVSEDEAVTEISKNVGVEQRFYIIGNLSEESLSQNGTLNALKNRMAEDTIAVQHLLLMGDNLKAKPREEDKIRSQIDDQLDFFEGTDTKIHYITGNREWNFDGVEGLEIIGDYLEEKLQIDDISKSNNGCPLNCIDLTEDIQFLKTTTVK